MPGISYLIDYENVHDSGLAGIENLTEEDCVFLFFTENANKLSLDYLADIRVPFVVKKVASGKQSLDMHLVSFLGYLIGCEPPEGRQYAVISHDSDFDGVCQFWCNQFGDPYKITRQYSIAWGQEEYEDSLEAASENKMIAPAVFEQLSNLIRRVILREGQMNRNNTHSILLSQLCTALNGNPAYQECRKQTGLKAQHMLEKYFASIVTIQTKDSSIWVYDVPNMYLLNKQKQSEMIHNEEHQEIPVVDEVLPNVVEDKMSSLVDNPPSNEVVHTDAMIDLEPNSTLPEAVLNLNQSDDIVAPSCSETDLFAAESAVDDIESEMTNSKEYKVSIISEYMLAKGIEQDDVTEIADWIALLIGDRTGKRAIYQAVLTRYGLKQGLAMYAKIRESLEKADIPGGNCFAKKRIA